MTQAIEQKTQKTYARLSPRLRDRFATQAQKEPEIWQSFLKRLETHFPDLFECYHQLYALHYDFYYHLENLLCTLAKIWFERPAEQRDLDGLRESDPLWYQSNQMLGGVCYVDLFAGDLSGIQAKIPYFNELGLTYLHLMPLYKTPEGDNDGGYAVSSYREVNPELGSMEDLRTLASELRLQGISLVLDLVFNHTSDEHTWAMEAKQGNPDYEEYYWTFPDRTKPDAYEQNLREIFPDEHPGAFTFIDEMDKWVWTTFHTYQWDLKYANPAVFNQMAEEMLFLANVGVDVLRLDAVAFIWKQLGTSCENLPQAHTLIQAFNAVARIAAPGLCFKSEAIVHPDEVNRYIRPNECQLSYNPLLMALLWNSLATREVRLLQLALQERYEIHPACSWVNYVRVHDDIGWTFSDEDAAHLWINARDHRKFLNEFYSGRFEGSFGRGLTFQENPKTGDARISGTCASLAGLEKAIFEETETEVELAIRRILLIHGIIITVGGIPLIYLGDEIGTLNDYSYRDDPSKVHDSRWVHRPYTNWDKMQMRHNPETIEGRIYSGMRALIHLRKNELVFSGNRMEVLKLGNEHVLGFERQWKDQRVIVLANFSEGEQSIAASRLRAYGLENAWVDLISGLEYSPVDLKLAPYEFLCLKSID